MKPVGADITFSQKRHSLVDKGYKRRHILDGVILGFDKVGERLPPIRTIKDHFALPVYRPLETFLDTPLAVLEDGLILPIPWKTDPLMTMTNEEGRPYTNEQWQEVIDRTTRSLSTDKVVYSTPKLDSVEFPKYIDHTLLKVDATSSQIDQLCDEAKKYGFKVGLSLRRV